MAYISKTEVEKYLGIAISSSLDAFISTLISFAQDYIERYCGNEKETGIKKRWFQDADTAVTKYYDGNDATKLIIDDIRTLTSLSIDDDAQTVDDDFYLYPLNESVKEWIELIQPETKIPSNSRLDRSSPFIFDKGQRIVAVTGKFGYSTTPPDAIKLACLKLVGAAIKENIGDTDLKEITQESLGDYSASYAKIKEIAHYTGVNDILEMYKRERVPFSGGGVIEVS